MKCLSIVRRVERQERQGAARPSGAAAPARNNPRSACSSPATCPPVAPDRGLHRCIDHAGPEGDRRGPRLFEGQHRVVPSAPLWPRSTPPAAHRIERRPAAHAITRPERAQVSRRHQDRADYVDRQVARPGIAARLAAGAIGSMIPALLISVQPPKRSSAAWTTARHTAGSLTSPRTATALPPAARISSTSVAAALPSAR